MPPKSRYRSRRRTTLCGCSTTGLSIPVYPVHIARQRPHGPAGIGAGNHDGCRAERPKAVKSKSNTRNGVSKPVDPNTAKPKTSLSDTKAQDELRHIARRDLAAQQIMAKFTQQLAVVGWIVLAVTSSGIFLIWRTLVHTRKAAKAAEDMVCEAKKRPRPPLPPPKPLETPLKSPGNPPKRNSAPTSILRTSK